MHHTHRSHSEPRGTGVSRLPLLLVLCVAQLMVILDISAVNVALPDMAHDLGIGHADLDGRSRATRWSSGACSCSAGALLTVSAAGASCSPA